MEAADGQTAAGLSLARAIRYALRRTSSVSAHAYPLSHLTSYRYETPATSVIQNAAVDPPQPRRPIRGALDEHCGFVTEIGI